MLNSTPRIKRREKRMSESAGGFNFGSSFALIVVLFVLLIIVGCSCTGLGGY
ncbi:sporulation protein YjcZ [Priestia megaterium]|jgi:uncharacterized protein (TIGR01732 family)|nr:sporulation protein YjcZ [Priestia megaterium]PEE73454.1 sporulation protein YjcZ [Priestia megaterium]PFI86136.1 sporulation protein YjcZ [Priestia megaterium]PGR04509.1 sporulation protein YjcZ [Priestia megaterium]